MWPIWAHCRSAFCSAPHVALRVLLCVQVPSQLVTCSTLVREVSLLAEMLAPIATPKLSATFKKALTDMFTAASQASGWLVV